MKLLFEQSEIDFKLAQEIGGKASKLLDIANLGLKVPNWCVLPYGELKKRALGQDGKIQFSTLDKENIKQWLYRNGLGDGTNFIVRSSMMLEDGGAHSFAGLFESFPNLKNFESILQKLTDCYQSVADERVKSYMNAQNIADQNQGMSIIIQVMIKSVKSGVLFSADPRDGARNRMLISAAYGAGQGVVDGSMICDEYEVSCKSHLINSRIADKRTQLICGEEGLVEAAVPRHLQTEAVLANAEVIELVRAAKKLVVHFGKPVDIEWTVDAHYLYFVQCRPITSMSADTSEDDAQIFDNSNIQESFNGLTLPLTFSYANQAYFQVYSQLMKVMGFSADVVATHDRRHQRMLALVKGRVYYNIRSWYEGLLFLPSFGRHKSDMEKMMGLERPVDFVTDQKLGLAEKIQRLPSMVRILFRLTFEFSRLTKSVERFHHGFSKNISEFPLQDLKWMSPREIVERFVETKNKVFSLWSAPIITDFYVMIYNGKVSRILSQVGAEDQQVGLLAGEELDSIKPTLELLRISDLIRANSKIKVGDITAGDLRRFVEKHSGLSSEVENFIQKYGDRVAGELKLETETFRQNRNDLYAVLRSYLQNPEVSSESFLNHQQQLRGNTETAVYTLVRQQLGPIALLKLRSHVRKLRQGVKQREAMRLERTRAFGLARQVYLAIAEKFVERGLISNTKDIFYLTETEIDDFVNGKSLFDSPAALISIRKRQYAVWEDEVLPGQVKVSFPNQVQEEAAISSGPDGLQGLGCYPGDVSAEVVVMEKPDFNIPLAGKILVAERTDPGWTPLFVSIAGLVVERGSRLSHSAVIARELGIPTIVGVANVMKALKSGDQVKMDGRGGLITVIGSAQKEEFYGSRITQASP